MSIRDAIYCDLEGPISGQDHALEVCRRFVQNGDRLFAVLSRYDDILALRGKEGYEPGDTLKLLIPFFAEAGVTERDLLQISAEAGLVPGIVELFNELHKEGCLIWIISTSYKPHAFSIARRVGVPFQRVFCTDPVGFPLDNPWLYFQRQITAENLGIISRIREKAVMFYREDLESGVNDAVIQELFDPFFRELLPKTEFGQMMSKIKVMGGRRKVGALEAAVRKNTYERCILEKQGFWTDEDGYLKDAFAVVDSITDFRMAQAVEAAGGVVVAWNGNRYVIPYVTCGVAAVNAGAMKPLFQAWREGGRTAVREIVEGIPEPRDQESGPYYHWLAGETSEVHHEVLAIHKRLRTTCRGMEAAKLG